MFLNLPSRNKRLTLDFGLPRSKSYLSTLNNSLLNKEKSYSTASLKEEFKQFKNKSLSYCNNGNHCGFLAQQHSKPYSPGKRNSNTGNSFINNNANMTGPTFTSGMKLNDFKKTCLNLDSKLSKTAKKEKDYFRPIVQESHMNQRYPVVQPSIAYKNEQQKLSPFPSTYLEVEKRLEQENSRRESVALMIEINELRELNELLRRENEELKKQRVIDLDLIARQNEIMQKQEELIEANQEAIYINKLASNSNRQQEINIMNESKAFTFSNKPPISLHICEECRKKNEKSYTQRNEMKVEKEFLELKIEKMEEEKQLLKKEIHELVYQSEEYKQLSKKTEEKYQKEIEHNQKLLKIIESMLESSQPEKSKHSSQHQYEQNKNSINRQPYLNLLNSKDILEQNEPISLKKDKQKNEQKENKYLSDINSPMRRLYEKNSNFKSASNLIKFNDRQEITDQKEWRTNNDIANEKQKEKNLEWCQNENIRKYLNEINKQKIKEIDQIESLLSNEY